MNEITNESLPWSTDDEVRLNAFLQTETGKRFIPKLAERVPSLLGSGDANSILIRSGEVRGFQIAISAMLELTHSPPLPVKSDGPSNYPELTDDEKWNDGQITQR